MLQGGAKYHSQANTFEHDSTLEKIRRVLPNLNKKMTVLDVGCGDGRLASKLLENVGKVFGLDVNQEGLKKAMARGLQTIEGDLQQPWPTQDKYNLILILDTLEHVVDCEFVLAEARRNLDDGGHIIITFPNHFDLRNRLNMLFGGGIIHWSHLKYENEAWNYGHVRFLTLHQLQMLFAKQALKIEKIQLNFMGGGIVPTKLTPTFVRHALVKMWPEWFSGKFTFLLSKSQNAQHLDLNNADFETVIVPKTYPGM